VEAIKRHIAADNVEADFTDVELLFIRVIRVIRGYSSPQRADERWSHVALGGISSLTTIEWKTMKAITLNCFIGLVAMGTFFESRILAAQRMNALSVANWKTSK